MMVSRNQWNWLHAIVLATVSLMLAPQRASAEMPYLDFSGFSYLSGPPSQVGTVTTVAAKFNPIQPNPLWPLDLAGSEYTVVVQGLTIASVSSYGTFQVILYSGGTIEVHADPAQNGTWAPSPPNGLVPATFLDGGGELIGIVTEMTLFYDTAVGTGTVSGLVDWHGGSRCAGLASPLGWTVFGGVSSQAGLAIPAGWHLAWDPQLYGPETPNPVVKRSWGAVKHSFRK